MAAALVTGNTVLAKPAEQTPGVALAAVQLLCLHEAIADTVIEMMMGAACELVAGNPAEISTDLGPVLHIVRWQGDPQAVLAQINALGAVVGVQPFGGESLSGTGPKAGGPHYLLRFCAEQTGTINTTAAGGQCATAGLRALNISTAKPYKLDHAHCLRDRSISKVCSQCVVGIRTHRIYQAR